MAYPTPPGHSSLPPKPPPSSAHNGGNKSNSFKPAFTAFAPRTVASNGPARQSQPQYTAAPTTNYPTQTPYTAAQPTAYASAPQYDQAYAQGTAPTIRNPFVPTPAHGGGQQGAYDTADPDYEAQLQQWQSAYTSRDDKSGYQRPAVAPTVKADGAAVGGKEAQKTVQRSGGGSTWTDDSLLEWDPAHFRIFVGNLAGEVTDDSLLKAFSKYPSVQKARVIRDKRTTKSKGYGFVSFSSGDEYFQAAKDMQGKYIGSHPVLIKRAMTEVRPSTVQNKNNYKNKNKNKDKKGGAGGHGTTDYAGIEKKPPKTKNGLRVLG